ncbi:Eaa protein [Salmonella enterica]|nr:Eaa protein [Salmonella enterica]
MTTITRERLKQIYAECEERDPAIFEIRELVRIALASLEAEPIGYMNCFTGRVFSLDEQPGADTDTAVYEPVYAAPPALVVPEEITDYATEQRLMGQCWGDCFCAGWNACRAAMLNGGKS